VPAPWKSWTYVQLPARLPAAPGQLTLDDVKLLWHFFSSEEVVKDLPDSRTWKHSCSRLTSWHPSGSWPQALPRDQQPFGPDSGVHAALAQDEQENSERLEDLKSLKSMPEPAKPL